MNWALFFLQLTDVVLKYRQERGSSAPEESTLGLVKLVASVINEVQNEETKKDESQEIKESLTNGS